MGGGVAQRGGREALLQAAGKMFDRYVFVLLLCSNASVFAGIIRSCLGRKTRLCGYKRVNGCGCIAFRGSVVNSAAKDSIWLRLAQG
jgi:hypothetical protein